jgi:methylase of polypeptide subunit release factors
MRRLANRLLRLRFLLFERHRVSSLTVKEVAGLRLVVLPQVFNPALFPTGPFLLEFLQTQPVAKGASVLDLGCGTGVCGLAAAASAGRVVCTDISPEAIRCARINVLLHRLSDRVEVVASDLFAALERQRYDLVLFNPPFYRGRVAQPIDAAWRSTDVLERFAEQLADHLTVDGHALVVFATDGDLAGLLEAFHGADLRVELVAERDTVNEILVVYRVRAHRPEVSGL